MFKKLLVASTTIVYSVTLSNSLGIARTDTVQADTRHGEHKHDGGMHNHAKTMEIAPGQPIPAVDLTVHQDPVTGWNLETKVSNFRFSPENASKAAQPGEGHAHIYVNGKKIARLYSSWYHLDNLPPGKNEITVGLNANSHEALVHNGKQIQDTKVIQVTN